MYRALTMKQVLMSILMFAITSCAVESAPVSTTTTTDDESSQTSTSTDDESPQADRCDPSFGQCETATLCQANGGKVEGVCTNNQGICCHFF